MLARERQSDIVGELAGI